MLSKHQQRGKVLLSEVSKSKPRTRESPKPERWSTLQSSLCWGLVLVATWWQQHLPGPEPEQGWARLRPFSCLLMSHQGLFLAEPI